MHRKKGINLIYLLLLKLFVELAFLAIKQLGRRMFVMFCIFELIVYWPNIIKLD
jgi:hypothetical protein